MGQLPQGRPILTSLRSGARRRSPHVQCSGVAPGPAALYQVATMDALGEVERARLVERFGRTLAAGETIYAEGDDAQACFIVQEGRVRLVKHIRSAEHSLIVLKGGDLFGEDALLDGAVRTASAVALSDVTVLALDRETLGVLLSGNPDVAMRLLRQLVQRLRAAEEQVENHKLRDNPSRVINTLLRMAGGRPGTDSASLEVTPLELSSRVGLDVDGVKRVVQQLRDGGYLSITDERIELPDLDAIRRLYQLLAMKEEVRSA